TYCAELDIAIESESIGAELTAMFEQGLDEPSTQEIDFGSLAHSELKRECRRLSVSRVCDLVFHDMQ
ncbi:MAG TPA: hypothetical protein VM580_20050, partial [Labilithrix sp.]|nr:hypothetical protein [Labilithrix sp.]